MEASPKKLEYFDRSLLFGLALVVLAFFLSAWATYRNVNLL
jgi:hypothetical protein